MRSNLNADRHMINMTSSDTVNYSQDFFDTQDLKKSNILQKKRTSALENDNF